MHSCHHDWHHQCHSHHVHSPLSHRIKDRNFIFGMNMYIGTLYMHIKYLIILTYSFSMADFWYFSLICSFVYIDSHRNFIFGVNIHVCVTEWVRDVCCMQALGLKSRVVNSLPPYRELPSSRNSINKHCHIGFITSLPMWLHHMECAEMMQLCVWHHLGGV